MRPVTIRQIASRLKLSPSTVSRALRESDLIQPQTRARVMDAAIRMGYQGSSIRAESLASEKSRKWVFGLVFSIKSEAAITHSPNSSRYLEGVTLEADAMGVVLTVQVVRPAEKGKLGEEGHLAGLLKRAGCHLLILQGRHHPADVAYLCGKYPAVSINWSYPGLNLDVAAGDDWVGTSGMVDLVASKGHRRLAWVGDSFDAPFYERRRAAFAMGAMRHGIPLGDLHFLGREIYHDEMHPDPRKLEGLVSRGVTAFVCCNDRVALEVIRLLGESGIRVPEDASVTGFDCMGVPAAHNRHLSTFDPNFVDVGRLAVRMGMMRLERAATKPALLMSQGLVVEGQTIGQVG